MKTVQCITASESGFVNRPNSITDEITDAIILFEEKKLSDEDRIFLFQTLIDSALVWQMTGEYQRIAKQLIETGMCKVAA